MAKTWDTSRTGGGTYEFSQDAQGRYTLNSVGFKGINKLDLPELKTGAAATTAADTSKKDIAALSAQTTQAFGDVAPFYYDKDKDEASKYITMRKEDKDRDETIAPITYAEARKRMTQDKAYTRPEYSTTRPSGIDTPMKKPLPEWTKDADTRGWSTDVMTAKPKEVTQVSRQNVDEILAKRAAADKIKKVERFPPGQQFGPQKTSPYQDAIMRGEIGVKKEKPGIGQMVTQNVDVAKDAINKGTTFLRTAAGIVGGPFVSGASMLMGAVKETPQNKHDKQYFNADREGGRISGNPTTDLYAGMNRVSLSGNLEKAGAKRIATREKAIARGNVSQKFINDTNNMREQQDDYRESVSKSKQEAAAKDTSQGQTGMGSCFIAGTKITMSDGTLKNIENIIVGDKVKGYKEDNTVIKLDPTLLDTRKLYSFNNTEHYFFTSEHPFMTEEGWKSIKPEKTKERDGTELYEQLKGELKIGDKVITEDEPIEITDIKSKEMNDPKMPLYNFNVSNDNSYVADKYIVHNKGGGGNGGNGGKGIICTQMYQQTQLEDWKKTMQLWYIFQKKYLTIKNQEGYHFLFKPFVKGMKKSKILTAIGKYCAIARTKDLKHIMFGTSFSFTGRLVRLITEPICYLTGKIKSWL
jgi:hypothetical protein